MTILAIILTALIQQITQNINEMTLDFESDSAKIEQIRELADGGQNYLVYILELFFKTPVEDDEVTEILSLQNENGSWKDIDYNDQKVSRCEQTLHAVRFQRLAVYHRLHPERNDVARALHAAISFWGSCMPVTRSWYYNQVNIPKTFAPGFLLFKDEMSAKEKEIAVAQMSRAKLTRTGQNLVWEAGNLLVAGLLDDNEQQVRQMALIIQTELKISKTVAGLQPDWSFLQHGAQLQFGNYGQSFAVSQAYWAQALTGTELALSEEKRQILKDYITKGVGRTIWGGYMDQNALGRQIFPKSQYSKALSLEYAMRNLGLTEKDVENGPRYYPNADFCNYRGDGWYASLRMQSSATIGYEAINNENMKSYFSADGALLVRREGDEFFDVAPVWNWRHVPGTTSYDDGKELWGTHLRLPYNKSSKVFGVVSGDMMAVAMEYDRDSVMARKTWIFSPDAIVCMGHDVTSLRSGDEIVTTVEQTRLAGKVKSGRNYVWHNGVTYVPVGSSFSFAGTVLGQGDWTVAAPYYGDGLVKEELFEVNISHGVCPDGATYGYCIVPSGMDPKTAVRYVRKNVRMISDTQTEVGSARIDVDWDKGIISISETHPVSSGSKETDKPEKYESESFRLSNQLQTETVKPGLQRQVLCYNNDLMLVKVMFGEEMVGQRPPLHSHPHSQSSYVMSGKFEFHYGDKVQILCAGDSFCVGPDIPHEAYCLEPGVIIDGFSPVREDFLK